MRATEIETAEQNIAFIKLMFDRTFKAIIAKTKKQAELAASKREIAQQDVANKKLLSKIRPTKNKEVTARAAGRPQKDSTPKL